MRRRLGERLRWVRAIAIAVLILLWARSWWRSDEWVFDVATGAGLRLSTGELSIVLTSTYQLQPPTAPSAWAGASQPPPPRWDPKELSAWRWTSGPAAGNRRRFWFLPSLQSDDYQQYFSIPSSASSFWVSYGFVRLDMPLWFPMSLLLWPTVARYVRQATANSPQWGEPAERSLDVCYRCGYDVRTRPERCPECGAIVVGFRGLAQATPPPPARIIADQRAT